MRIACRVVVLMSLSLLASCGPPVPSETVQLSRVPLSQTSAFDTPLDNAWREVSGKRPAAVLLGRAETTRVILPRKAVLRVSCDRRPSVRITYDVGLKSGPIAVAYRFDTKTEQKGVVRVRGAHRNMLVIDNAATVTAFDADLRNSSTLKVRASRPPFQMHDAYFRWDRDDKTLNNVLSACNTRMLEAARRQQPASRSDDEDDEDDIKDVLPEQ